MVERTGLEIAIIGMSGRFPQARDIDDYWRNLCQGIEAISNFTAEEIIAAGVDPALVERPDYVKAASIIDDADCFDAALFGYSPREAETMDPQQRLFLQASWHALEHAGYAAESYAGAIGVYAGAGLSNYLLRAFAHNRQSQFMALLGNDKNFLTTRASYKLNLTGPSIDVQTACSTSLVAVHLACQALLSGECDMALAGGIAVKVPQKVGYLYEEGGILSPDGHCRAFDAQAQGTVVGNGVGIVVLKRLQDAQADGDTIWAVLKGTAINNDGAHKIGYTAPSVEGQAAVIQAAQLMAEVDPATIGYVETHGTGTPLGDPIEIAALTQVFRAYSEDSQFCAIGSVKSNIGHLDAAAGVAGLIKAVLALHHRKIPPSLHFTEPNPQIPFARSPFYVNTMLREWPNGQTPRRAAVSSFGIGGTNAHAVLEEAPPPSPSGATRQWQVLPLSAQTPEALDELTTALHTYLAATPDANLADVAHTLQVGRVRLTQRRTLVCRSREEALTLLADPTPAVLTTTEEQKDRPVIFLFPGQGAQYVNMGRGLYETETVFREAVDLGAQALLPHLEFDLRDVLYPAAGAEEESTARLQQTVVTQPALFIVEYALAQLLMSWGVRPQAMIGHSSGEYVAACLSGVFSLEDGLALIAARGRLMQNLPAGSMLAVHLTADETLERLPAALSLAATNAPRACVVSGPDAAVAAFSATLREEGIATRPLLTSHAFHSTMMDPILAPFKQQMAQVALHPPVIPYISNTTGDWIREEEATSADYWAEHLRQTVNFAAGLETLLADEGPLLLEVGPGHTLASLARRHPAKAEAQPVLTTLRHVRDQRPDDAFLLQSLARLWLTGVRVDWEAFVAHEQRRRLPLPLYPFARERYWLEEGSLQALPVEPTTEGKQPLTAWFYQPQWQPTGAPAPTTAPGTATWLLFQHDHRVGALLHKQLVAAGHHVVTVQPGPHFAREAEGGYMLDPAVPQDYDRLLAALDAEGLIPERVLHLWLADDESRTSEVWWRRGFNSLLYLAQAWVQREVVSELQIDLVTTQVSDVSGNETVVPAKVPALAPLRVLPQEHENVVCRHLDIALPTTAGAIQRLEQQLWQELVAPLVERSIALRGRQRWVQHFVPLDTEVPKAETPPPLRAQGVYLFSGPLTPASQILAHYLASNAQARLVFLDSEEENEIRDALATQLETAGATAVVFYEAEVSDAAQVMAVIDDVETRFGTLHGVLHTAGAMTPAAYTTMEESDTTALDYHFRPKIEGVQALQQTLADRPLDFCLFHSSLAALLGGVRFLGQVAADLYLDSLAHHLAQQGRERWLSVNWDAWQGVGQPALAPNTLALSDEEVQAALAHLLSLPVAGQVAISTHSLPARLAHVDDALPPAGDGTVHARPPHLMTPYLEPRNDLEMTIVDVWEDALGIHPIGVHDNFFELGGHSLLLTQIVARVREQFPVELSLGELFAAQTVADLALAIVQGLAAEEEGEALQTLLEEIEGAAVAD